MDKYAYWVKKLRVPLIIVFLFWIPQQSGSSNKVYKTRWNGDPRVNIQNSKREEKIIPSQTGIKSD